jgi:hypothetical protein
MTAEASKTITVRGDKVQIQYDFNFNGQPSLWSFKDEWIVNVKSVNGIHWKYFQEDYLKDVESEILFHEFKLMKDSKENKIFLYQAKFSPVEEDGCGYDKYLSNL